VVKAEEVAKAEAEEARAEEEAAAKVEGASLRTKARGNSAGTKKSPGPSAGTST
jgi:hypothetical protein